MPERWAASVRNLLELPGAAALQNYHPLVVHFPVALLSSAALIYWSAWIARRESWWWTAWWLLTLGAVSAVFAWWTGWRAGAGVMVAPSVREHILEHHRRYMTAVLVLSLLLSGWGVAARPVPRRGRIGFMTLLIVMMGLLVKGADYGAWMVYGYNAGGSLPQPIEFSN